MTLARNNVDLRIEICRSDFKCFNVKFYVSAHLLVTIKLIICEFYPTFNTGKSNFFDFNGMAAPILAILENVSLVLTLTFFQTKFI